MKGHFYLRKLKTGPCCDAQKPKKKRKRGVQMAIDLDLAGEVMAKKKDSLLPSSRPGKTEATVPEDSVLGSGGMKTGQLSP